MGTSTINISIPETMKADVEEVIAAEGYGNTSEFFRDLVRNYLKQRQQEKFESMLIDVIEKEEFTELTKEDFENVRKRGIERLKTRMNK